MYRLTSRFHRDFNGPFPMDEGTVNVLLLNLLNTGACMAVG